MHVVLLLARGIEGCGVTKYAIELEKWLLANGHQCNVVASKDKRWGRHNAHSFQNHVLHVKFDHAEFELAYEMCRSADLILINSVPSISHPEGCIENYGKILDLPTKKVFIQHDHNKLSMRRNALLLESVEKSDLVFAHSDKGDFAKMVHEKVDDKGPLSAFFDDSPDTPIYTFQPGIDMQGLRLKYWKLIEEQDPRHHKWIGRTTFWKGFGLMFQFANDHLMKMNHLATLEGIEKSPAYLALKDKFEGMYEDFLKENIDDVNIKDYYGKQPLLFTAYENNPLMERMSKCAFGYQLSLLDPKFLDKSLEFTHLETICTGTIPVFRKEYGDNARHRTKGGILSEYSFEESGTLWLGEDNQQEVADMMEQLSNNAVMRNEYREKAYEFYSGYDAKYTYSDMFNLIQEKI